MAYMLTLCCGVAQFVEGLDQLLEDIDNLKRVVSSADPVPAVPAKLRNEIDENMVSRHLQKLTLTWHSLTLMYNHPSVYTHRAMHPSSYTPSCVYVCTYMHIHNICTLTHRPTRY